MVTTTMMMILLLGRKEGRKEGGEVDREIEGRRAAWWRSLKGWEQVSGRPTPGHVSSMPCVT